MEKKPVIKIERMHPLDGNGPTKAFCDLVVFNTFVVKGLRIVEGKEGLFVSMPREQGRDGKWYDTFYPVSLELRKGLQTLILDQYSSEFAKV